MKHLIVTIVCICAITAMVFFALSKGIDGVIMGISITAVAGLGGYELNLVKSKVIKK